MKIRRGHGHGAKSTDIKVFCVRTKARENKRDVRRETIVCFTWTPFYIIPFKVPALREEGMNASEGWVVVK